MVLYNNRYLQMHVLITNRQFLLLIDVPNQDPSQQLSTYKIFILHIPHGDSTAHYDISTKYLGITQDETMAVDISPQHFRICKEANGQFCTIPTLFQPLANAPSCITACMPKTQPAFWLDVPYRSRKLQMLVCPHSLHQMFGFNYSTLSSNHHNYPHMPGRNSTVH